MRKRNLTINGLTDKERDVVLEASNLTIINACEDVRELRYVYQTIRAGMSSMWYDNSIAVGLLTLIELKAAWLKDISSPYKRDDYMRLWEAMREENQLIFRQLPAATS